MQDKLYRFLWLLYRSWPYAVSRKFIPDSYEGQQLICSLLIYPLYRDSSKSSLFTFIPVFPNSIIVFSLSNQLFKYYNIILSEIGHERINHVIHVSCNSYLKLICQIIVVETGSAAYLSACFFKLFKMHYCFFVYVDSFIAEFKPTFSNLAFVSVTV